MNCITSYIMPRISPVSHRPFTHTHATAVRTFGSTTLLASCLLRCHDKQRPVFVPSSNRMTDFPAGSSPPPNFSSASPAQPLFLAFRCNPSTPVLSVHLSWTRSFTTSVRRTRSSSVAYRSPCALKLEMRRVFALCVLKSSPCAPRLIRYSRSNVTHRYLSYSADNDDRISGSRSPTFGRV